MSASKKSAPAPRKPRILFVDDEHDRFKTLEARIGDKYECIYRPGVWSAYEFLMGDKPIGDDDNPPVPECPVDLIMLDYNLMYFSNSWGGGQSWGGKHNKPKYQPQYQGEDLRTLEEIREARDKRLISKQVFKRLKREAEQNGGTRHVEVQVIAGQAKNVLVPTYGRDALIVPRKKAIKLVRSNAGGGALIPVPSDDPRPPATDLAPLKSEESAYNYFRERMEGRKGKERTEFQNAADFAAAADEDNYNAVIDEVLTSIAGDNTDAGAAAAAELMDQKEIRWPLDWDKDVPGTVVRDYGGDAQEDYASHFYRGGNAPSAQTWVSTPRTRPPHFHKRDEEYRNTEEIAKCIKYNWPKTPIIVHSNCPGGADDLLKIFEAKTSFNPLRGIETPQCVAILGAYERIRVEDDGTLFFDVERTWGSSTPAQPQKEGEVGVVVSSSKAHSSKSLK